MWMDSREEGSANRLPRINLPQVIREYSRAYYPKERNDRRAISQKSHI